MPTYVLKNALGACCVGVQPVTTFNRGRTPGGSYYTVDRRYYFKHMSLLTALYVKSYVPCAESEHKRRSALAFAPKPKILQNVQECCWTRAERALLRWALLGNWPNVRVQNTFPWHTFVTVQKSAFYSVCTYDAALAAC